MVVINEVKRGAKNAVVIRWDFPVAHEPAIGGFIVSRARKADGPYIDITSTRSPAKAREIVDADISMSSYYHVKAVDKEGKEITHSMPYFFHVEDNIPPSVPTGLSGTAEKNGIVTLKWKPNSDKDLLGYRVFSSNSLRDKFVEVTLEFVPDSLYQDSINVRVLNKKIYYKVVAVDYNYNNSDYSKPCTVARPDIIAPAVPVFSKVEVKDKVISLKWINSISDDVSNSTLYRTTTPDNDNTLTIKASMLSWEAGKEETSYIDNTAQQGKVYQYVLETSDSAGNMSTAVSKKTKIQSNVPEDVTDFKALINREEKNITLKWNYGAAAKKCLLYRKKNDESFSLYQTVDGTLKEFIDKQIIINNTYSYRVQLVLETNAKTKLSETLKVPF
jgi:fibronectin type 3 domain-containing protein